MENNKCGIHFYFLIFDMNTKQVIVVRHDLIKGEKAVRRGKMMAQVAHASIASLLKLFIKEKSGLI